GALFALGLLALNAILGPLVSAFAGKSNEAPAVAALFRDPREAPQWIFAALVGGGFVEELERAFVLSRFEWALGQAGLLFALVVDSAAFDLGHLYQGVTGAITTAITGLLLGLIYMRRRKAADAAVAHACYALIGVAIAYAMFAGCG